MEEDEDVVSVGGQRAKKKDVNVNVDMAVDVDGGCECECECACECACVCSNAIDVCVADVGAWQCLGARIEAAT